MSNEAISPLYANEESKFYKTVDDFRDFLKAQDRQVIPVDTITNIKFSHDATGKLNTNFGSGDKGFTEGGFSRFCKTLGVPARFVSSLPHENTCKDLYASLYSSGLDKINFIVKKDRITGVASRDDSVSTLDLMDKVFTGAPDRKVKEISFYNETADVSFTRQSIAPILNDQIDLGLMLSHDDSYGSNPSVSLYFWRLICENGAVAKQLEKIVKFGRMNREQMFTVLGDRVESSLDTLGITLGASIKNMSQKTIPDEDKKYYKAYLRKKLSFEDKGYLETKYASLIEQNSSATYYDLMNYITDSAKDFDSSQKTKLLVMGGEMVSHFKDFNPTLDVLRGFTEFKRKKIYKEQLLAV